MDNQQLALFPYEVLDSETRIVVQQENKEFDQNMEQSGNSFIKACKNVRRIHEVLLYKRPGFVEWCNSKPKFSERTAYKMVNIAKMFAEYANISIKAKEALYLLSAPSTPDEARQEAIERATNGETITHQKAQGIIAAHHTKPEPIGTETEAYSFFNANPETGEAPEEGGNETVTFNYKRDNKANQAKDIYEPKGYDACQTPAYALDPLLPYLDPDGIIWEPAAGEGYLVEAFYDSGFRQTQVIETDLLTGQNFFDFTPDHWDCLVTNPPYSIKYEWLERCYQLGRPFALLVPVETLGAKTAQALLEEYGFEMMLLDQRVDFKMPVKGWDSSAPFPTFWLCWQLLPEKVMFGKLQKVEQQD